MAGLVLFVSRCFGFFFIPEERAPATFRLLRYLVPSQAKAMLGRQKTIPGSLPHVDFDDFASVSRRKEDIVGLSKGLLHDKRAGTRHLQVIKRELNLFGGGSEDF